MRQASPTPAFFFMSHSQSLILFCLVLLVPGSLSSGQSSGTQAPAKASSSSTNQHALELARQGHCSEAVPLLKKAILQSTDKDFRRNAGLAGGSCAMVQNEIDAAEGFLAVIKRRFASNAGAEYVLGELAREAQQWDDAIKHFTRAAKLDSAFGDAFLGWGVSLVSTKKFTDAVAPLEVAVKLEPQNPAAHYNLAIAYTR